MRVRFNGMLASNKKGCGCGHRVVSDKRFVSRKTFILPSGNTLTVRANEEYEVNDIDANFLLSYSQIDGTGIRQSAFTKVE